jgi:hypothetical protein
MERTPVSSSSLHAVGYDADASVLEIEFVSGSIYQYDGVPQSEFDALMSAGSKGKHFNASIKGRYSETRLR